MLKYNQEILLDSDTHRIGSYLATNYELPFPENEILQHKENKEMRRIWRKYNDLCRPANKDNCSYI